MKANLLVIGGTGFIGRSVVSEALRQEFKVTVVSLNLPKDKSRDRNVCYLQVDITDFEQLKDRLESLSFQYVVNLSGYVDHCSFLGGGYQAIDAHFSGVQNVLRCLDWGVLKRFVQIGSSDEYGSLSAPQQETMKELPISSYSLGKLASTQLLQMLYRTEDLPVVIFRLFLVYGEGQNRQRFLPQIIQGCLDNKKFPTSEGKQLRDFCHVDDISKGILSSLLEVNDSINGEVINLASGCPTSIRNMIEYIQNIIGRGEAEFGKIPYRSGENMTLYADISKAKQLLNWEPLIKLDDGLKQMINDYNRSE